MAHLKRLEDADLAARVEAYNARCKADADRVQLARIDDNGSGGVGNSMQQALTCRGPLRLYWDVRIQLNLVESDGSKPLNRHYYYDASSASDSTVGNAATAEPDDANSVDVFGGVKLRRRTTKQRQIIPVDWRRSVNGHAFMGPSCVQPEFGQSVTVLADIQDRTHQVLSSLFSKFMIRNPPDLFCLTVLAPDGWELNLGQLDCPLRVRLSLGPEEALTGKLLVREVGRPSPRASVIELAGLPTPLLRQLLASIEEEEMVELTLTRKRFSAARLAMEAALRGLRQRRDDIQCQEYSDGEVDGDMSHL